MLALGKISEIGFEQIMPKIYPTINGIPIATSEYAMNTFMADKNYFLKKSFTTSATRRICASVSSG